MLTAPKIIKIAEFDFKVEGFTQEVKSIYEQYMYHHICQAIKDRKRDLGDEFTTVITAHILDAKSGTIGFGTASFIEFLKDEDHLVQLLWVCLSKHQPIDRAIVATWVREKYDEAFDLFVELYEAAKKK